MSYFRLTLNMKDNFTIGGGTYSVIKNKLEVGTCTFNSVNNNIVGYFSLTHNYKEEQYLKYNTEQKEGKTCLVNLEFSDIETSDSVQAIKPHH